MKRDLLEERGEAANRLMNTIYESYLGGWNEEKLVVYRVRDMGFNLNDAVNCWRGWFEWSELNKLYPSYFRFSSRPQSQIKPRKAHRCYFKNPPPLHCRDVCRNRQASRMLDAEQLCINLEKALYTGLRRTMRHGTISRSSNNGHSRFSGRHFWTCEGIPGALRRRLKVLGIEDLDKLPEGEPFETNCNRPDQVPEQCEKRLQRAGGEGLLRHGRRTFVPSSSSAGNANAKR